MKDIRYEHYYKGVLTWCVMSGLICPGFLPLLTIIFLCWSQFNSSKVFPTCEIQNVNYMLNQRNLNTSVLLTSTGRRKWAASQHHTNTTLTLHLHCFQRRSLQNNNQSPLCHTVVQAAEMFGRFWFIFIQMFKTTLLLIRCRHVAFDWIVAERVRHYNKLWASTWR